MFKEVFVLKRDVHSIQGRLLLKKMEPFDLETMESLGKLSYGSVVKAKIKETFVYKDIFILSKKEPYSDYCNKVDEKSLFSVIGEVSLPLAVFEEYHFMRIKDDYTYRHCLNTSLLSAAMAMQFFDDRQKVLQVISSSLTHDIGKSRIPSKIIHAHMPLTDAEFEVIKEHPLYGAVLCSYYLGSSCCHNTVAALQHHEKLNGKGYPIGISLKDDNVMFIIVADIFDALISKRPYRNEPYDVRGAIDILCQSVEQGEIDEEKLKMLIHLNRKSPPPLKDIKYAQIYRGHYPRVNYYGLRKGFYSV
ncbi:MAG: hypothetical protein OHK0040_02550 [bacterium]